MFQKNRITVYTEYSYSGIFPKERAPSMSCIFVFTIATIFARDSRQQCPSMHKCNSTLNTLSSIANQTMRLSLAMRFYQKYHVKLSRRCQDFGLNLFWMFMVLNCFCPLLKMQIKCLPIFSHLNHFLVNNLYVYMSALMC